MAYPLEQPPVDPLPGSWTEMELAIVEAAQVRLFMREPAQGLAELEDKHHHTISVFIEEAGHAQGDSQGHARGIVHGRVCAGGRDIDGLGGVEVLVGVLVATVIHHRGRAHGCN